VNRAISVSIVDLYSA